LAIDTDFRSDFNVNKCEFYDQAIDSVQGIYDYLGKENDLYVNYVYYLKNRDDKFIEAAREKAYSYWNDTVSWMKENDIPKMFECILLFVNEL